MSQAVRLELKVRPCLPEDADRVLNVHRSAIRGTAAPHYPNEVIQEWASPITSEKIKAFADSTLKGEETRFVAELDGQIVGFGAIVESLSELRAVYVSPNFGRVGVGTTILREAEKLARSRGLSELHMDASINAEPFYRVNGYVNEGFGEHTLRSGQKMACVRMRKNLSTSP